MLLYARVLPLPRGPARWRALAPRGAGKDVPVRSLHFGWRAFGSLQPA